MSPRVTALGHLRTGGSLGRRRGVLSYPGIGQEYPGIIKPCPGLSPHVRAGAEGENSTVSPPSIAQRHLRLRDSVFAQPPHFPPRVGGGKSRREGPRSAGGGIRGWKRGNGNLGMRARESEPENPNVVVRVPRCFEGGVSCSPLPEHPSTESSVRCPELLQSQFPQHPARSQAVYY